jgi:hypothetical protein
VVIHIETVWAATQLGAISRANRGAISLGCRSAIIGYGGTAVFMKHDEWTIVAGRDDRKRHLQHSWPFSTPAYINFRVLQKFTQFSTVMLFASI